MSHLPTRFADISDRDDFDGAAVAHVLCIRRRVTLAGNETEANERAAQWTIHDPRIATTIFAVTHTLKCVSGGKSIY